MPPLKRKAIKKTKDGMEFEGYQFQDDAYVNQMAYVFGGEDGERAAKKILEEAERRFPNPVQLVEKKKFIEDEIKKRSQEIDSKFQNGIEDVFRSLLSDKKHPAKGKEAGKDLMFNLMRGLGLNVDADNVQTHYDPGPPAVFQITWINRPTENLKNENSNINKLANMYSDCLAKDEKDRFNETWGTHKSHAMNGEPKMEKSEFLKKADESFQDTLNSLKSSDKQKDVQEEHEEGLSPPNL
ncbi:Uncharacterised protein [Legionella lansingensis]|uniref:Uncharacterized protein n=1 Tax=Legionella lansingensis TaxID=45067 RepID=A0A0W0VLI0_9GAMM|nr:hypothetical protein [Legionella lansingensis]KTD20956.1 hypothetical protein Llan_1686 [Legionella lansingensis]SNV44527.1 Uncharacterised protein [Legionella lansingensis]